MKFDLLLKLWYNLYSGKICLVYGYVLWTRRGVYRIEIYGGKGEDMALQVWLPLTKDLRNQGLNGIPVASTGTISLNDNGKLGKCYKTSNTGFIDLKYAGTQINTGSISLCGWFKFNKSELAATWSSYSFDSTHPYPTGNLIGNNSYGGVGLIWYTNSLASGAAFTSLYVACSIRSTTNGARITSVVTIPFDTWVHLALVFNKTTKALELWMNGELKVTNTMLDFNDARADNLKLNYSAVWGGNGPSYNIPFLVNDVRIYDHALSQMEVKELSKGLILHYPLTDAYVESTTNLITTEDCLSATCYNGATSKYGYGTNTDMYKTVTTYDGRKGTKVYMGTNGNAAFPYVYINNMYTSDGTNSPAYKTLSFDYYTNIGTSIRPYKLGSGSGTATYRITNKNGIATGTGTDAVSIPVVTNGWNHIEITFHGTTAADSQWGYIQNYPSHTSNTSNFWFFANMQLETKDHATGYAGAGGTRNSNIVYDCSGFCNNGEITGALHISHDTPKYKYSTIFSSGANFIRAGRGAMVTDGITVSIWTKYSTWGNPVSCTEGGGWNFENGSNNIRFPVYVSGVGYKLAESSIAPSTLINGWHMITGTFDKTNVKIYIDGELKGTTATGSTNGIAYPSSNVIFIGAESAGSATSPESYNFVGNMSDFRIYATALSASDVKSLYQNCATIDADGTIYGQIRS